MLLTFEAVHKCSLPFITCSKEVLHIRILINLHEIHANQRRSRKMSQKQDLRNVYDLLDKLCRKFSPDKHKEILKTVTATIADSQNRFLSGLQFDETIIVSKIKNHLAVKNESNLSTFLNLHHELSTLASPSFRSSILTLLLYLSDMESKLPNTSQHEFSRDSVFSLPVKSRAIESSGSMQEMYKNLSSRVSFNGV